MKKLVCILSMAGLFGASTVGAGCVTKGKFNELKREYDDYKHDAEARDQKSREVIADLEAKVAKLTAQEAQLRAQIDGLNAEKILLATDRTRMLATEKELMAALKDVQARKAQAEARIAEFRGLLARFKGLIDAGKLKVRIVNGRMTVELATDVLFPSGSAVLSAEGKAAVTEVAKILATIPERGFQIEGHTDNIPIRTARYRSNWDLAFDRAHSVLLEMIEAGMPSMRISAASHGEFKPRVENDTDEHRSQNRRIEIIVVPDLSQLPGADELEKLNTSG